ncbi:hypothetical protein GCM10023188_36280 [Pontibacter saemangeumensis]|uniref:Uncharacterized protein n=1 Tax=Pontibacter saemangeumensis TaxID=1084525 RepID=A0ABP8LXT7_9BACT
MDKATKNCSLVPIGYTQGLKVMKEVENLNFSCSTNCKELNTIVNNFKTSYYRSKAENFARKQALTQMLKWGAITAAASTGASEVIKQVIGRSAGVVVGILYPSDIGTNSLAYGKSLDRINKLISVEGSLDAGKIKYELDNLRIAAEGIKIEQEWGNKKECYSQLLKFTNDITRAISSSVVNTVPRHQTLM